MFQILLYVLQNAHADLHTVSLQTSAFARGNTSSLPIVFTEAGRKPQPRQRRKQPEAAVN